MLSILAESESDTERLGRLLADSLPDQTTVALVGTLGAGKTRLVQAVAVACGIDRRSVNSPTFVLCQPYEGRRALVHIDAYRLHDEDEFRELGPEEYFASPALVLIEWADRIAGCLPERCLQITIDVAGSQARRFTLTTECAELQQVLHDVEARWRAGEPGA